MSDPESGPDDSVHMKIGDSAATMRAACGVSLRDQRWTQNPPEVTCLRCHNLITREIAALVTRMVGHAQSLLDESNALLKGEPMSDKPVSAPPRESRFDENNDGPECINCALPKPEGERWQSLELSVRGTGGGYDVLESWPLCPDCEISQPATLVEYVKYTLS